MGSMAIDGLISGLKTTDLINQLMAVEAAPQDLLKTKVTSTQSLLTAYQSLNTSVSSLASYAKNSAKPTALDLFTATASAPSVSVTAGTGAAPGQLDLPVTSIAKAQVSVTAAMSEWPDSPATFTIVKADGSKVEITANSTSMSDIADAISASTAGVKAARVSAGKDGTTDLFRLQLTSAATGADGAFQVFRGTAADVTAGTATNVLAATGAATVTAASDASVTLWAGTPAEQVITSSTNSFADILPGVTINVTKVEASPVSVTVAKDSAALGKLAENLVANLTSVFNLIDSKSTVTKGTDSTGKPTVTAGVFIGNSTVREVTDRIMSAATSPVDGRSPSEIGISITKDGGVSYDSAKFQAALAKDPEGTLAMFQKVSARIGDAADSVSDQYNGTITQVITGQKSSLTSLNDQISSWDVRLAAQRAGLERTYSALEVSLSNLQAQSSWLTSQLAGLSSGSSSS
ncbi:MAG: flagellar filament capping protein FliD [Leifsonia sp.]|nr:flagellar filament capping protein FliD [Leifsonia sp.]